MRAPPEVSVVVPVYDGEALLGRCIESLLAQEGHVVQVIVVDDGSRDATLAVATSFPVTVLRRAHRGVCAARNAGGACATAPFIGFCDHDDEWRPTKVARQVERLRAEPRLVGVLCGQEIVVADGVEHPPWLVRDAAGVLGGTNPISGLFRADAIAAVGGFDEHVRFGEDLDLLVRMRERGGEFAVLDDPLLVRHVHESNMSHELGSYGPGLFSALRRRARRSRV
jgi:glycosyltransferase involved in cell wall biosynthesis